MKTYRFMFMFVLLLALSVPAITVSAAAPQLTTTPTPQPPTPTPTPARFAAITLTSSLPAPVLVGGEVTFDLALSVANIEPGVAGADIYLSYDPALVTPSTTPGLAAAEVLPDFFGVSNFSINEILPAGQCPGGSSPCVHLVLAGPAQTYQTGIAARFHFRALATGSACFSVLQSTLVDGNGFDVYHSMAQKICRPIQGRNTNGVIKRQGVPANPNPGGGTLACANVSAINNTWSFGPITTDPSGNFGFVNLPTGTYTLRAVYPGYLASEKAGVVIANNTLVLNVDPTTLRGGDVNGDNVINILDIGSIISKFGRSTDILVRSANVTNCGLDEAADINDDGRINISDLAIATANWASVGPTAWISK